MKREEMAPTLQKSLLSPRFCFEGWIQGMWALKGAVDSPPRSLTIMWLPLLKDSSPRP